MTDKYICVAKCPELDCDNHTHCIDTLEGIQETEDRQNNYCPCGNTPEWKKYYNNPIKREIYYINRKENIMTKLSCSKQEGFYSIPITGTNQWSEVSFNPLEMEIIVWRKSNTCNSPAMPEKQSYKEFIQDMKWNREFNPSVYEQKLKVIKRINNKLKSGKW